jgi:hypothetical protein
MTSARRRRLALKLLALLALLLLLRAPEPAARALGLAAAQPPQPQLPRRLRPPPPPPPYAPQPPPLPAEVRAAAAGLPCAPAPAGWPPPARVHAARFSADPRDAALNWTDAPLLLYTDVAVAEAEGCARLTRARGRAPSAHAATAAAEDAAAVLATHLDAARLPQLLALAQRWQGCVSAAVRLCAAGEWEAVLAARAAHAALRANVTFHAVLSHGLYPNALRNAPLEGFAPWAPRPRPWVVVVDVDGLPSVGAEALAAWVGQAAAGRLHPADTLSARAAATAAAAARLNGNATALEAEEEAEAATPRLLPRYLRHLAANNTLQLRLPSPSHFTPDARAPGRARVRCGGRAAAAAAVLAAGRARRAALGAEQRDQRLGAPRGALPRALPARRHALCAAVL